MTRRMVRCSVSILLVLGLLFAEVSVAQPWSQVQEAEGAAPAVNTVVGFMRILGAFGTRNEVYREAGRTAAEVNAYYDRLIKEAADARKEIFAQASGGERLILARSYIRVEAMLRAERKAAIRMIEAEKNKARKDFDRTVAKTAVNIMVAAPGPQKVIGEIRQAIRGAREAAVAVQSALEGGKPIEALGDALSKKVGDIGVVQELARGLGSMAGRRIDRALGGVAARVGGMIGNLQAEVGEGIGLLDQMDAEVAVHDNRERQPVSLVEDAGMIKEVFTVDRKNPVVDVVASAFAGGAARGGNLGGAERGEMRDRIRDAMLAGRITRIQSIAADSGVGNTYCIAVGKGEYEAAAQRLGQAVQQARDPERAVYLVCYDNQSNLPVLAKLIEEETQRTEEAATIAAPVGTGEILAGTYVGKVDWTAEKWNEVAQSMTGEVTIIIANDGTVSGSFTAHIVEITTYNTIDDCSAHWEWDFKGTFNGQITSPIGVIESSENWRDEVFTDCPDPGGPIEFSFDQIIDIQINQNTLTGTTRPDPEDPEGLWMRIFTATKQ